MTESELLATQSLAWAEGNKSASDLFREAVMTIPNTATYVARERMAEGQTYPRPYRLWIKTIHHFYPLGRLKTISRPVWSW